MMEMNSLGLKGFVKDIEANKINENTTIYYLLLFKYLQAKKLNLMQYYESIVEVKSPFRSKSIVMNLYDMRNPE